MRAKKLFAAAMATLMVVSLTTGCGNNATTNSADTPKPEVSVSNEADKEKTEASNGYTGPACEIHYAYWQDTLGGYLEECKAKFEAANPNITIVLEPTAWGEYWTKLETASIGGTTADVFQMNGPNIYKYADAGIILPLDEKISGSSIDLANYPDAMNNLYNIDGKQFGIPIDYDTIGLWYNKELFDAKGVAYPTDTWTWEDMVAAAEKLTDKENGVYGIAAGYADQGGFFNTVYATGGYILNDDKTKSGFSEAGTVAGIKCWTDLMEAGLSPSQASLSENADYLQFMSGKLAMLFAGDWYAATFIDPEAGFADKCDVAFLPLMDGKRATCIHGKANCILAETENPEAAWAWVEYLGGEEANEILGKAGAAIPAHTGYSNLFFEKYPNYNMGIFATEAVECSYAYPASRGFNEWADVVWNELIPAYSLETSIEEACAKIAKDMDDILARQ